MSAFFTVVGASFRFVVLGCVSFWFWSFLVGGCEKQLFAIKPRVGKGSSLINVGEEDWNEEAWRLGQ